MDLDPRQEIEVFSTQHFFTLISEILSGMLIPDLDFFYRIQGSKRALDRQHKILLFDILILLKSYLKPLLKNARNVKCYYARELTVLARSVRVALVLAERGRLARGDGGRRLVRLARRAVERHHPVVRVLSR